MKQLPNNVLPASVGTGGMGEVPCVPVTRLNRDVDVIVFPNSKPKEQTLRDRPTGA